MGKLSKKTKKFVAKGGVDIAKRSNKKRGRKEKLKKGASAEQAHGSAAACGYGDAVRAARVRPHYTCCTSATYFLHKVSHFPV